MNKYYLFEIIVYRKIYKKKHIRNIPKKDICENIKKKKLLEIYYNIKIIELDNRRVLGNFSIYNFNIILQKNLSNDPSTIYIITIEHNYYHF